MFARLGPVLSLASTLIFFACTNSFALAGPVSQKLAPRRHLSGISDGANHASIWGLNYLKDTRVGHTTLVHVQTGAGDWVWDKKISFEHVVDFTTTGAGVFKYLGNGRILYQVPAALCLVINEISGGNARINGLSVGTGLTTHQIPIATTNGLSTPSLTEGRISVHYLFGPGEDILFEAAEGTTIVGFTADPAYMGSRSVGSDTK